MSEFLTLFFLNLFLGQLSSSLINDIELLDFPVQMFSDHLPCVFVLFVFGSEKLIITGIKLGTNQSFFLNLTVCLNTTLRCVSM